MSTSESIASAILFMMLIFVCLFWILTAESVGFIIFLICVECILIYCFWKSVYTPPQDASKSSTPPPPTNRLTLKSVVAAIEQMEKDKYIIEGRANMDEVDYLEEGQAYFCMGFGIGVSPRKGYSCFPIKGMKYRLLDIYDVGRFEGMAELEEDNEKDPYAIAIYREDHTHLGYLPARNRTLYKYIKSCGGYVHCIGYVATTQSGIFYGEVAVETDHTLVRHRNKEYATDKYYDYEEGDLKNFLDCMQGSTYNL